jgi:acylphosphatase
MGTDVGKQVTYSGRVQGVGFRYTCQRLAEGFAVSGYVRNLPDGKVELLAEGAEDQVRAFLDVIAGRMAGCIENCSIADRPLQGFKSFSIRH